MTLAYLDNAATTLLAPEVKSAIIASLDIYGNPSSIHQAGREARAAIEQARKSIAHHLKVKNHEIIFTSGGTEANNLAIFNAVAQLGVQRIITSAAEHAAVFKTVQYYCERYTIPCVFLPLDQYGHVSLEALEEHLSNQNIKTLVTLMSVNNELGSCLPVKKVADLCQKYGAYFHTDAVQALAHQSFDLSHPGLHFLSASAHKFHGPKGAGLFYRKENLPLIDHLKGGGQERGLRSGTENLLGIIGLSKAMELVAERFDADQQHLTRIMSYTRAQLQSVIPGVVFNSPLSGSKHILNIQLPLFDNQAAFLFLLDMKGVCVSIGSACSSGSSQPSAVLKACGINQEKINLRLSFSRYTSFKEVEYAIHTMHELMQMK